MNSQFVRWFCVYLLLPLLLVVAEASIKALVFQGRPNFLESFPYVSLLVVLITVSIFTRDEIAEYTILDPEDGDTSDKAAHKALMMCQTVGLSVLFVLMICFEAQISRSSALLTDFLMKGGQAKDFVDTSLQSNEFIVAILRFVSIGASFVFGLHVLSAQKRFKLKAS